MFSPPRPLLLLALAALGVAAVPQPPSWQISPGPLVVAPAPFTRISSLRVLPEERLFVVDEPERRVHLVNMRTRSVVAVGRTGSGPGEYRWPRQVFPLDGGRTGLVDGASPTMRIIAGDGQFEGPQELRGPPQQMGRHHVPGVGARAADTLGRFYGEGAPIRLLASGALVITEVAPVVRWRPAAARNDTLAHLPRPPLGDPVVRQGRVVSRPIPVEPFRVFLQWTVSLDGHIGIVHPAPYRIEIITPDGRTHSSAPLPDTPVPLGEDHKQSWRESHSRPIIQMVFPQDGRQPFTRRVTPVLQDPARWPRTLPAVTSDPPLFDHHNRLWVVRTPPAGRPPRLDVFTPAGGYLGQVVLPPRTRVIGFGEGVVYLARRDGDDLEHLQQHRLPAGLR